MTSNLHRAYTLQDIPNDAQVVRCPGCGQMEIWGIDEMTDHGACRSRGGHCPECGQSVGRQAEATRDDELEFFEVWQSWNDIHADMQDIDYSLDFDKQASAEAWTAEMVGQLEEWGYIVSEDRRMAALPGMSPFDPTDTTIDDDLTRAAQIVAGRGTYFRYLPQSPAYTLPSLRCLRCGHTWTPRTGQRPGVCPKCKHRRWDEPKKH